MNFQFCLKGTPIDQNEAAALLTATRGANKKPLDIELSNLLDFNTVDSKKLFELAVENNNQALASLAWKVSVDQKQDRPQLQQTQIALPKKIKQVVSTSADTSIDNLIDKMAQSTSHPFVGAAMLLKAANDKEWITLRETALSFANTMWAVPTVSRNSRFFRGLTLNKGKLTTLDLSSGVPRRQTFHVSPLYISLREGLVFCIKEGLVEQRRMLSTGCTDKSRVVSTAISQMKRMYYKVRLTNKGRELCSHWGDIEYYIAQQFAAQVDRAH
jgi:hypothetical protein